ncbi:MAG: ABC transporter ATP-binding protein [Candidatus Melainabacteria bacterium HGW-Melainabacteria-1]|nr:MAG: ABC transporter ATP-binding protein [Candidatus Melainabacteria bacterium HGW-Melainabacteria-1]
MSILEIHSLSKRFGKVKAVRDLDLTVQQGNIYGILGPNGSGKTTTLGMILGVIHPDQGSYSWFGAPPPHHLARRRIGVLLETPNFYPYLSAEKNLAVVAAIKGCGTTRIEPVLKQVGLWERRKSAVSTYSLGMRQRMALAAALLPDPDVLVLDEPTNGLDPQGIADVRRIIQDIGLEGKTIILASHILDEVEKICTQVAVMKQGQLLAAGDIGEVLRPEKRIMVGSEDLNALREALAAYPGINAIRPQGPLLELSVTDTVDPGALNHWLFGKNIHLSHLQIQRKGLEETFLELVADDVQAA